MPKGQRICFTKGSISDPGVSPHGDLEETQMILNAMNVRVLGDEGCEISAGLENQIAGQVSSAFSR